MDPDIRAILEAGTLAPSGENVQPWRFRVHNLSIELHHADVDSEIYDTGNRGSLISHGACIENMCLKAASLGYKTDVQLFPDAADKTHIAQIHLEKDLPIYDPLVEAIENRVTNRNKYRSGALAPDAIEKIRTAVQVQGVEYMRIPDRKNVQTLARVGSVNEEVMLQNETLHDFFFDHVTWTKEEDAQKRVGFYIKTLGLPAPIQALFKLLKKRSFMKFMKGLNFPTVVGKGNAATYAASAEIGMLCIANDTPEQFIQTGRALQRIWLAATAAGISLQPLAGTLFMHFFLTENPASNVIFSEHERSLVETAYSNARIIAGDEKIIAFMFRVGYGKPPEARSSRFPLEHFLV